MKFEILHISENHVNITSKGLFTEDDLAELKTLVGEMFSEGKFHMSLDLSNLKKPDFEFKDNGPFSIEVIMLSAYKDWTLFKCQAIFRVLIENGKSVIKLNLENIPFIESFGIGILMGLRELVEVEGGTLELELHPKLNELFQKFKLHQVFKIVNE